MRNLMYEVLCSDIKLLELKLQRIKLTRKQLLKKKPFLLNSNNYKNWLCKLNDLTQEEEIVINELQNAYDDLAKFL